jgi:DNA polymerase III delta prime subunit
MPSIAVLGPPGSGKSTFCYNFSRFLQKQGHDTAIANANYFCRHITYVPDYDVRAVKPIRKLYEKHQNEWPKFYEGMLKVLFEDAKISELRASTTLFLDMSIPLEYLIFYYSHMKTLYSISDRIILLSNENFRTRTGQSTILAASYLMEEVSGRQVVPVFNRPGFEKPERTKQATLFEMLFSGDPGEPNDVIEINAVERLGFRNLAEQLKLA